MAKKTVTDKIIKDITRSAPNDRYGYGTVVAVTKDDRHSIAVFNGQYWHVLTVDKPEGPRHDLRSLSHEEFINDVVAPADCFSVPIKWDRTTRDEDDKPAGADSVEDEDEDVPDAVKDAISTLFPGVPHKVYRIN